jgi:hypothetical protein
VDNERSDDGQRSLERQSKAGQADKHLEQLSKIDQSPGVKRLEELQKRKKGWVPKEDDLLQIAQANREDPKAAFENDVARASYYQGEYDARERECQQKITEQKEAEDLKSLEQILAFARSRDQAQHPAANSTIPIPPKSTSDSTVSKDTDKQRKKMRRVKLTLPLQFDGSQNVLIDAKKNQSLRLRLILADVIRAMFSTANRNKDKNRYLSYADIGNLYERGRIKKESPQASEKDIQFRLDQLKIEERPAYFAQKFARSFRRELDRYQIPARTVFGCDEGGQNYYLINTDWHEKKPAINCEETNKMSRSNPKDDSTGDPKDENE